MSATERAMRLHKAAQRRVRAEFLRELLELWPLLDPARLDDTSGAWVRMTMALIVRYREESAALGFDFYDAIRADATDQLIPLLRPGVDWSAADRAAVNSLRILGPIGIKKRAALGIEPTKAAKRALVEVSGSATRHVLTGGREAIDAAGRSDDQAVGFARHASGSACAFCKMLASRGAVYLSRDVASRTTSRSRQGAGKDYHDDCTCQPVPLFSRRDPLPPGSDEFAEIWASATRGKSGKDAIAAFREATGGH